MIISSVHNDKVKEWTKLQQKKYRDEQKRFLIEGDHLVNIALKKNLVEELIVLDESNYDFSNQYVVSKEVMKKISLQDSSSSVIAVCKFCYSNEIKGNVLILDDLQDPGNLGTIIRSAVAFNFETIILSLKSVDVFNEKVIRASEGMLFDINCIRADLRTKISELKNKGYTIYGTDVIGGKSINKKEKLAIIIGNEGAGMTNELKESCDELIHIPMTNKCESLNAGVAASILMYEVYHE